MPTVDLSVCTSSRGALYAHVLAALKQEQAKEYAKRAESVPSLNGLMQLSRQYVKLVNRLAAMS